MRKRVYVSLLMVLSHVGITVNADDRAASTLRKAIKAHGGEKALRKYQAASWSGTGTLVAQGVSRKYSANWQRQFPHRLRVEFDVRLTDENLRVTYVVTRKTGWTKYDDGPATPMAKTARENLQRLLTYEQISMLAPLLDDKRFVIKFAGNSTVRGTKSVGLNVTSKDGIDINLFFDRKTMLLVKQEYPVKNAAGTEFSQAKYLSKYRKVRGVFFPMKIRVERDGKLHYMAVISKVTLKERLDDSIFKKP